MMTVLHDYWRSSAAYRLRIALNLAKIPYDIVSVDILAGEHQERANLARNPQGLVPTIEIDDLVLTQSLSVLEYLDETRSCNFLPKDARGRARVRALSYAIAMEIHPVCNLSVARYAVDASEGKIEIKTWMNTFIGKGLSALERMLSAPQTGQFCHGNDVSLADICLVPQLYNARRWEVDLSGLDRINAIGARLESMPEVAAAHPDKVKPDA